MTPLFSEEQRKLYEKWHKEVIKRVFEGKIKINFLLRVFDIIMRESCNEVLNYFDMSITEESLFTGIRDSDFDYEICKMIIGYHKSNTIGLGDSERSSLQNDSRYMNKLKNQVIVHIRIRKYSSYFFRKEQLISGDEFMYFPVLYKLFAISTYASSILLANKNVLGEYIMTNIFNKSLAAMTLIENNFFDSAYPLVRGVVEIFIKLFAISDVDVYNEYLNFINYGIMKTANGKYPDEYIKKYESRVSKKKTAQSNFLHFGWVDVIKDYHGIVKERPYCTDGLFDYAISQIDDDVKDKYELLRILYKRCHEFSHGNIGNQGWPLMHYFDLTIALYIPIVTSYIQLCKLLKIDTKINEIDIVGEIYNDFELLLKQFNRRHEEKFFENYYK